ncbi:MAG: hypothetical protein ACYCU8_00290 [Ferrimicrobium acidiphilum]
MTDCSDLDWRDRRIAELEDETAKLYVRAKAAEAGLQESLIRETDLAIRCYRAESELAKFYECTPGGSKCDEDHHNRAIYHKLAGSTSAVLRVVS